MSRLLGLIKLYSKYLILVPLFLFAIAVSTYLTERAVNRYYVGRDLRLLAAAADQIESDYQSQAHVERNRPRPQGPSTACAGMVTEGYEPTKESQKKQPPDLRQNLSTHVRTLIRRNLFSVVIVAKEDGTVLAQEPSTGPRFSDLSALLRPINLHLDTSTDQQFIDFSVFVKSTNVRQIGFAGQEYWAFAQPFQAYRGSWNADPEHLVLVGLLPSRSLWSAPLDFTRRSWVVALLGTLAAFAFWPMLKLWFAKPGTDLRSFEVFRFVYSLLALASIATFAVLYLAFQHQRELNIDYQLDQLAREVREESSKELNRAVSQLKAFDRETTLTAWGEQLNQVGKHYKAYDAATWIDENGCQLFQYVKEKIGYAQNLGDRDYFKQVHDNKIWTVRFEHDGVNKVDCAKDQACAKVVIESVRSRATSLPVAVLAMTSEKGLAKKDSPKPVAVLTIPFESIMKPVLPDDYGFALVDENGKVHFHSDPSRGAGENILIETANDSLLYSSLIRRTEKTFSVQYQGAPHRVHVTRFLLGTPWSLVVFHNLSQGRRLQLETLLNALVLFFVYAACVMGFTALAYRARYVVRMKKWGTWRSVAEDWAEDWLQAFHTRSTAMNVALAVTYLFCLVLLALAAYRLESAYLLLFTLALQIAATVIAWVPADNPSAPGGTPQDPNEAERIIPTLTLFGLAAVTLLAGKVSGQFSVFLLAATAFAAMGLLFARIPALRKPDRKRGRLARYSYILPATLLCVLSGMGSCFIVMVTAARHSEKAELRTSQLAFAYAFDRTLGFSDWTAREGVYDKATVGAELQPIRATSSVEGPIVCQPRSGDDAGGWTDLWGLMTDLQFASAGDLQSSRDLHNDATHDGSWGWCPSTQQERESARSGHDSITFQRLYTQGATVGGKPAVGFQIKSEMPHKLTLRPLTPQPGKSGSDEGSVAAGPWRYWLALGAIAGLLPWFLHCLLRACLMTHVKPICLADRLRTNLQEEPGENTMILLPAFVTGSTRSWRAPHCVDLNCISSATQLRDRARELAAHSFIVFENFQSGLVHDEIAVAMLDCLNELTIDRRRKVVILSTAHPVQFLMTNSIEGASGPPRYSTEYIGRWHALTERFVTEIYPGESAAANADSGWRAWLNCSKREQHVLTDISWNSLAHPRYKSIVRELMRRKLVHRDPVSQLLMVEGRVDRYAEEFPLPVSATRRDPVIRERGGVTGQVIGAVVVLVPLALFAFEQDLATKLAALLGAVVGLPVGLNRWLSSDSLREKKTTEVS